MKKATVFHDLCMLLTSDGESKRYVIRKYALSPAMHLVSICLYLIYPILPARWVHLKSPIFMIGCSRSGTTISNWLFKEHDDLADWSESPHVMERKYYDYETDHYRDESHFNPFIERRVKGFWGLATNVYARKQRFVNKHPQNSLRIRLLLALFPDAKFIHVYRDPRAVVLSHIRMVKRDEFRQDLPFGSFPKPIKWRDYINDDDIVMYAKQWRDVVSYIVETSQTYLNDGNYMEINYDEFCNNPHEILRQCDTFCGLDSNRRRWQEIPDQLESQNDKWGQHLSETQIQQIEAIALPLMQHYGLLAYSQNKVVS